MINVNELKETSDKKFIRNFERIHGGVISDLETIIKESANQGETHACFNDYFRARNWLYPKGLRRYLKLQGLRVCTSNNSDFSDEVTTVWW